MEREGGTFKDEMSALARFERENDPPRRNSLPEN
jgi:hypothetical protein